MGEPCSVQVTAGSAPEAEHLARLAVERHLAACGQVSGPITSTYRWEGQVRSDTEWVCTLKTVASRVPQLAALLRAHHSYDLPEIVATPIVAGDPDYLAWVEAETSEAP